MFVPEEEITFAVTDGWVTLEPPIAEGSLPELTADLPQKCS
jgi:hypothetical protein